MREILKQLFGEEAVTDDIIKQFNAELGKKFVAKADFNSKIEEIKNLRADKKTLEDNISEMNEKSKNSEDVVKELNALKAQIEADTKKAESDRILREKLEADERLFLTAVGDKKFSHEAVKKHYFDLFRESLGKDENKGKSANDILKDLTQNDETAFASVTAVKLKGGRTMGIGGANKYSTREEINAIKDPTTRQAEMIAHAHLFPEIKI